MPDTLFYSSCCGIHFRKNNVFFSLLLFFSFYTSGFCPSSHPSSKWLSSSWGRACAAEKEEIIEFLKRVVKTPMNQTFWKPSLIRAKLSESQRIFELQKAKPLETAEQRVLRIKLGEKMHAEIRVLSHTKGDEVDKLKGRVYLRARG